jgi:hypothetical protein
MSIWNKNPPALTAFALVFDTLMMNTPGLAESCPTPRFLVAQAFEAGGSPQSVAMGDFNRDGNIDAAVANNGSNNVTILSGKGEGTFQTLRSGSCRPFDRTGCIWFYGCIRAHPL